MKKGNYFTSKARAMALVALISGGALTLNSCKDEAASEITIQDSEDTESANADIKMKELEEEYDEKNNNRDDSLKFVLDKLQKDHDLLKDKMQSDHDLGIQSLSDSIDLAKEDESLQIEILKTELAIKQNDVDKAELAVQIAGFEADEIEKTRLAAEELKTAIAAEELLTYGEYLKIQQKLDAIADDSITNAYSILSSISGEEEDKIDDEYSLMKKATTALNTFIGDTATSNKDLVLKLDGIKKEQVLTLLKDANTHLNAITAENKTQLVRVETAKLTAEKALDAAQKAYDDYVESKSIVASEDRTELTFQLFSKDADGNESLLGAGATITLDGSALTHEDGATIVVGDLEGDHYVSIAAPGHLTTSFAFKIAEDSKNDDADGFELLEKKVVVKLLKSTDAFTVKGEIKGNTTTHAKFSTGTGQGFDYLDEEDAFEVITDADIDAALAKEMAKNDKELGTDEPIDGLNLSVKVKGNVSSNNYVTLDAGVSVSSFLMVNATAITAKTGANGEYTLTGVPVLNNDFTVEIVIANTQIDQEIVLYGQNNKPTTPVLVQKTKTTTTQTVQNKTINLTSGERENGVTLFKDLDLF